jgi:hypothetical protein
VTIREMETKTSNSIYVDEQENRIQLTNSTKAVVSPLSLSLSLSQAWVSWRRLGQYTTQLLGFQHKGIEKNSCNTGDCKPSARMTT